MKKWIGLIAIVIIAFSMMLTGCTPSKSSQNSDKRKDELVISLGGEPDTGFDPTTGWGRYGSPLFQSTLFKRDHALTIVNDLATNYEVSQDGKIWTVTLRDDVTFFRWKTFNRKRC